MNPHTKPYVEAIFQRTYEHHGVNEQPFGISKGHTFCSYAGGCAIGISLPDDLRREVRNDGIRLLWEEDEARVGPALFGDAWAEVDDEEINALAELQTEHDSYARLNNHPGYMRRVEQLASHYGLSLSPQTLSGPV